jgi:hypothetical protein
MWGWRRSRKSGRTGGASPGEIKAGARLVREVEAFLSGSSEQWFFARGEDIPAWAYINKVAHAEPDHLCQLASWAPAEASRCVCWRDAVAILAKETIEAGESDPSAIRRIQLDGLAALESQLISRTVKVAPQALVALGRACLGDRPSGDPPF